MSRNSKSKEKDDSRYKWFIQVFITTFILLITGCYSSVLGANILLKEENDKTIEYLNSLPIKRKDVVLSKIAASLIYISLMIIILMGFNYVSLLLSEDFNQKQFFLLVNC